VRRGPALAAAALALALGACAAPPVPEDRWYRLDLGMQPAAARGPALPGMLAVALPVADGIHRERAIVYSTEPGGRVLEQYHYHHWVAPPPDLVQAALVTWLRGAGVAPEVMGGIAPPPDAWVLSTRLERFERLVGEDGAVEVAVALGAFLRAPQAGHPRHLADYQVRRRAAGPSMVATVRAFEDALQAVAARLAADLAAVAARRAEGRLAGAP
jgi:uncharacterized lipoprotein YmbA